MKRRYPSGIGIAAFVTLLVVLSNPVMAWTPQRYDANAENAAAERGKWPPRNNRNSETKRQVQQPPREVANRSNGETENSSNPWARKPPRTINVIGKGKRPWGGLPDTVEIRSKTQAKANKGKPAYAEVAPVYRAKAYPPAQYQPPYDPRYGGQQPGYGNYAYPGSYGPWDNNNAWGNNGLGNNGFGTNSFPFNNFPFSFW